MVLGRICGRRIHVKKLLLLLLLASVIFYLSTVFVRIPKERHILDVKDFKNITVDSCQVTCPVSQLSFYIKTGVENKKGPTVCFENKVIISHVKKNVKRGLNLVVIDDETLEVVDVATFDTYMDDVEFVQYAKTKIKERHLVIVVSNDEVADSLHEEGRRWLMLLGSQRVGELRFRDSFLLIGQKGLQQGAAIEFVNKKEDQPFAPPIEKMGCFSLPMGKVLSVKDALPNLSQGQLVQYGHHLPHCGMPQTCPGDEIPVMVNSGKDKSEFPEICVADRMMMMKGLNDAGRGMNFVVVNSRTGYSTAVRHFDTYSKDSTELEQFLENLSEGDIIIGVVFDDASTKMSFRARELINKLGSSMIQNLKFRDTWYFVGQFALDGFTLLEKISYAGIDGEWPNPLMERFCVPRKLKASKVIPDPPVNRNDAKRHFCKTYDGYGEFCDPAHVDDPIIKPVAIVDAHLKDNPVYSSPIVIVPGLNHNALVRTMETTAMQPGVHVDKVVVTWNEEFPEQAVLADLFNFRNLSISSSTSYPVQVMKAMEGVATMFPDAVYMIVLEEELILGPDFLNFMAQCSFTLQKDSSLYGVSAFNFNGYESTSGNRGLIYRVEDFPGLGFMLKMDVFRSRMKGDMKSCCNDRAWSGWTMPTNGVSLGGEMLVPDVSRVFRQPYEGSNKDEKYLVGLFQTPRKTNLEKPETFEDVRYLEEKEYEAHVRNLIKEASVLGREGLGNCAGTKGDKPVTLPKDSRSFAVYYKQKNSEDYSGLTKLSKCFGLFSLEAYKPKNLHKGLLWFTKDGHNVFLIGSLTSYVKYKPSQQEFLDV